ncbi:isochorismate synthase [Geminicoccus harenae]|uniref:isochorismate synthase n=2 Tax=Geminicoccus harenae TaxID=2498453 RepID=UPI001C96BD3C|nr:isochorismate synthase [Geminicoccus harenae]
MDVAPDAAVASADTQPFVLVTKNRMLVATGCRHLLSAAEAGEPETVLHGGGDGAAMLVGALPYDRSRPPHLFQPETVRQMERPAAPAERPCPVIRSIAACPDPARFQAAVARVVDLLASGQELRKVVLSRALDLVVDRPIDVEQLVARLALDEQATVFAVPLPAGRWPAPRCLVGATPELLLAKNDAVIRSHPLAGSARRSADRVSDRSAADGLIRSDKDRREHAMVVEAILDQLAPCCRDLARPPAPELIATRSMWHLGTRIEGRLKDPGISSVRLAGLLHPTPAVCGTPRDLADRAIRAHEGYERDFYAGAVGWCDAAGDGAWYVSIRCAEIAGTQARLYAGAGIVAGSDPAAELEETQAKFTALLAALGVDAPAAIPPCSAAPAQPDRPCLTCPA